VDLCGHATLATAFVIMTIYEPGIADVEFTSQSGVLRVSRGKGVNDCNGNAVDVYTLDFPARPPTPIPVTPAMSAAIGANVLEAYASRDLVLVLEDEAAVRNLTPDFPAIAAFSEYLGVCVTAKSSDPGVDFVSRFFCPKEGIDEDPVTGSAHCNLAPLWGKSLGKTQMYALQLSPRGGHLALELCASGERVLITGRARLYLDGEIHLDTVSGLG